MRRASSRKRSPGVGQLEREDRAVEQHDAQLFLYAADDPGQRWLRDVEFLGRLRDAAETGYLFDVMVLFINHGLIRRLLVR